MTAWIKDWLDATNAVYCGPRTADRNRTTPKWRLLQERQIRQQNRKSALLERLWKSLEVIENGTNNTYVIDFPSPSSYMLTNILVLLQRCDGKKSGLHHLQLMGSGAWSTLKHAFPVNALHVQFCRLSQTVGLCPYAESHNRPWDSAFPVVGCDGVRSVAVIGMG